MHLVVTNIQRLKTGLCSTVGSVSICRYVSDCRSSGACSIPNPSHTLVEFDHEIISTANIHPLADSRFVVSKKLKCVHEVLGNCFVKLGMKKVWLGELMGRT